MYVESTISGVGNSYPEIVKARFENEKTVKRNGLGVKQGRGGVKKAFT